MSAEREFTTEQRRFTIEESITQNGGKRTIFVEHMSHGTAVPPHYHNRFSETFDLISGSMTVYRSEKSDLEILQGSAQALKPRDPVTVTPGIYHQYVAGPEPTTTLRVILTPGDADFERLLMILDGLARDGELESYGNSLTMMAVVMGLSDAHVVGPAGTMLDGVKKEQGADIEALREKLLAKYDNEESLRNLLGEK